MGWNQTKKILQSKGNNIAMRQTSNEKIFLNIYVMMDNYGPVSKQIRKSKNSTASKQSDLKINKGLR